MTLVNQVQTALQMGQRAEAVRLLKQALRQEPQNAEAWSLAAELAPNAKARQECLARAAKYAAPSAVPTDSLDHLRHRSQATAEPAPSPVPASPVRRWAWRAAAAVLLVVVLGAGILWWRPLASPTSAPVIAAVTATATPTPLLTLTADAGQIAAVEQTPAAVATATPTVTPNPIQPKQIASSGGIGVDAVLVPRATWTITPSPTPTETPTPTPQPTLLFNQVGFTMPAVAADERWIDVNLTTQQLNAYEGTTVVFSTAISSGLPQWATVTGQFRIYYRLPSQTMDGRRLGFDYVTEGVPYVQYFYQDFALHGAFWHNNFGQPMSHGCVNLSVSDSEWLYNWATYGTLVSVHY